MIDDYDKGRIKFAILEVLESGDQDRLPWALYEHDHSLKGFAWTKENAMIERINFTHAVVQKLEAEQ